MRNANGIETRKSLMIIGPAIKKLAKNVVIPPALEGSQSLHENFDDSTNGSSIHPKGSKNLAIVDRMAHLVRAGANGTVTQS